MDIKYKALILLLLTITVHTLVSRLFRREAMNLGPSRVTKVLYNPGHTYKLDYLYCEKNLKYIPHNIRYLIEVGGEHVRTSGTGPILIISNSKKYYTLRYSGPLDVLVPNMYYGYGIASDDYETVYNYIKYQISIYSAIVILMLLGFMVFAIVLIFLRKL